MTIRKYTGLEGGFSILPNATINDNLSWEALGLLAYLCSKPDDWEVCIKQLVNHSKFCQSPSGRDKTYKILNELQDRGYMLKLSGRNRGRFTGVEYIVSPSKIPEDFDEDPPDTDLPETVEPDTDLPDTDLPDTVNPTQQNKDLNKERKKHIVENVSTKPLEDPQRSKRKRHDYTPEFETFFKLYPKTNGSKLEAFKVWKNLAKDDKDKAYSSISGYKNHLSKEPWQKAMIPARYLRQEHFLVFGASNDVLSLTERVLINGRPYAPKTILDLCTAYFSSSEWKFDSMLGPAPDHPETLIPAGLIDYAKRAANA